MAATLAIASFPSTAAAELVQGAGSTFALPVLNAWKKSFLQKRSGGADFGADELGIDYEPVGSLAGIMRLGQPDVDFAASDAPLSPEQQQQRDLAQFPLVMGGLAVVTHLDGVEPGQLKLTGDLIAQIYLGKIARWNDPALAAVNPGLALPDLAITPLHRQDGSGSTLTFTSYLAGANADWKAGPGSDTLLEWPAVGSAAEGTSGLIKAVKATQGALAYVEFGQAEREKLDVVQISNRSGNFITPGAEAFSATAASANWEPAKGFYLQLADLDQPQAYPLTAVTFALMHKTERSSSRTRRALFFLAHGLEFGGQDAAALGYVPIPANVVDQIKTYWRETLPGAAGL